MDAVTAVPVLPVVFDGRKTECPALMVACRCFIAEQAVGSLIHIVTCAPTSVQNITAYCEGMGYAVVRQASMGDEFHFMIEKAQSSDR